MIDDVNFTEDTMKENDYTLSVIRKGEGYDTGVSFNTRITRTFNFLAQQVTTMTRDITYQGGGYKTGGSSGVSTAIAHQRFDDFQSDAEIRLMHEKLTQLGGKPPALDEILPSLGKAKLSGIAAGKAQS